MRVFQSACPKQIKQIMRDIKVDPYGIELMSVKAGHYLMLTQPLSNITANILKQEMLSLGADAAVARGALTGSAKKTGCLLMGNLAQYKRLSGKLKAQPFGLGVLSAQISEGLRNFQKEDFILRAGNSRLNLAGRTLLMGILNLTPDSFSGDGLCGRGLGNILEYAQSLERDGADIIDVGGESSRPGARPVELKEELKRVISVIKALAKRIKVPLSVDTYKPQVARQALDNGATIVNDISGLNDRRMAKIAAGYKAAVVIMHMKGNPRTMQRCPRYDSLIGDIISYFENRIESARSAGISAESIIVDPGIGFGKTLEHNLEILRDLSHFKSLGKPILAGTSRKSFIGKVIDAGPQERLFGTVSSCVIAANNGAKIIRAHDCRAVKQALVLLDRVNKG